MPKSSRKEENRVLTLDFIEIATKIGRDKKIVFYPKFLFKKSSDLMIKGGEFYAFWDSDKNLWNTSEFELATVVNQIVINEAVKTPGARYELLEDYDTGLAKKWHSYCRDMGNNWIELDKKLIFSNTARKKTDYCSRYLPYPLEAGKYDAYDHLMSVLYDKKERKKIEWAIGSIIAGDSNSIQKFYVLYGPPGSGKSTILDIIQMLFQGYCVHFRSKDIGNASHQFALEPFADNPLIAIDHEGKLDHIDDNTRLNTLISHEPMLINEKRKKQYTLTSRAAIFIGTNTPVRITDSKSGVIRRLIDICPSGRILEFDTYTDLMNKIPFELSGIAYHCLEVYLACGKEYYNKYKPTRMLDETNDMFNFVQDMLWEWEDNADVSLASAWNAYKEWCDDCNIKYPLQKKLFKTELKEYFDEYYERLGNSVNIFRGFQSDKFKPKEVKEKEKKSWLTFEEQHSNLDDILAGCKAQYATEAETPRAKWANVKTKLSDLDTSQLHYVKMPNEHYICIDFDIKNDAGEKDYTLNLAAASKWPATYAELSKGGQGIHLHYIYDGDVSQLSRIYDEDIEVKVFNGDASLRRRLSKCNNHDILTINSGLPLKGDKKVIDAKSVESERHLRVLIKKCLNKENHGHTAPEVDFIKKLTDDAYANKELSYDIRDMRPMILSFAMSSTNQSQKCYDICSKLKYCSKDHEMGEKKNLKGTSEWDNAPIVFFDVEVFPNLFIVCWKKQGKDHKVVRMINPTPEEVKQLFVYRLVGFNNRRYDNHIIYARGQGYTNAELYKLSQKIINKVNGCFFGEAYGLSYTDIYDYCSNDNKKSLKKWEIELGIYHMENSYPWDKDVPEDKWEEIADYCCNDVIATEATFDATQSDFRGRQILAELSGLTVNDTSNTHTQQIIFGNERNPQRFFNYPNLAEEFPGYVFDKGVSTYMGETVGEGGWVFSRPGMYVNAVCEDVSGMHPASIYAMKLFGDEYTERYYDLVRVRTHIKHKEYDAVRDMFEGRLAKYLGNEKDAEALSKALKTPINSVYGLTAAHFPNRCRDPRNVDNVVAKRGALFMITLKNKVEEMGYTVIHCKTDSIKVADPDDKILRFIEDFGKQYGYSFEIEDEFERICLTDKATFIARFKDGKWFPKAATFAHPYIFKTLFTGEKVEFKDLCETKEVKASSMYLDFNENLPDVSDIEKEYKKLVKANPDDPALENMRNDISKGHSYHFIGRIGLFTPILPGNNAGILVSTQDDIKYDAVAGTKGFRWMESDTVKDLKYEDKIDMRYFDDIANSALAKIDEFGDPMIFINAPHEEYEAYARQLLKDKEFEGAMNEPVPFR